MTERALSFGAVAEDYERFRPGYPDRLVEEITAYAGKQIRTAVEIGAGTGKATRVLTAHGISVTATEPDPAMLAELRKHVSASATTIQSSFEDLDTTVSYDLVFAAASLHWTQPAGRWSRVASLLEDGGVFANAGGPLEIDDPSVDAAVRQARHAILADDDVPSPDGTPESSPMQWPGTELLRSPLFDDVRQLVIERRFSMPASDYVGYLSTVSAYQQLPPTVRAEVLTRIAAVLPPDVRLKGDLTLHLARVVRPTTTP